MALNVKNKIWLGTLFLFLLLLVTGGVGIYYVAKLKIEGKKVLQDNYESLSYCYTMQLQLNHIKKENPQAVNIFEDALKLQATNITEPGEGEATNNLRSNFTKLKFIIKH